MSIKIDVRGKVKAGRHEVLGMCLLQGLDDLHLGLLNQLKWSWEKSFQHLPVSPTTVEVPEGWRVANVIPFYTQA